MKILGHGRDFVVAFGDLKENLSRLTDIPTYRMELYLQDGMYLAVYLDNDPKTREICDQFFVAQTITPGDNFKDTHYELEIEITSKTIDNYKRMAGELEKLHRVRPNKSCCVVS